MDLFVWIIQVVTDLQCEFHVSSMIRNVFIENNILSSTYFLLCTVNQ